MSIMDATTRQSAIAAVSRSTRHLAAAYKNLIGYRLPLAGIHCDAARARLELEAAQRGIAEAIALIGKLSLRREDAPHVEEVEEHAQVR